MKIGRFQTALLLTVFYFLVVAPMGAVLRLCGWDPLQSGLRHRRKGTNWKPVKDSRPDLASLRRQS